MTTPAVPTYPTLDGIHLADADTSQWDVRRRQMKSVTQLATGDRREFYSIDPLNPALPMIKTKLEVVLVWEALGDLKETVEELMAVPGPHELVLWRAEFLSWAGNGSRAEFTMPWRLAIDIVTTPPQGLPTAMFEPQIKVGSSGSWLTYVSKDATAYAAGAPTSTEVWFLEGGTTFKLSSAPAAGTHVFGRVVPVIDVYEGPENDKQIRSPLREPRRLTLLEA